MKTSRDLRDALVEAGTFLAICLVLAGALYLFGGRRLFTWGWPWVVAVLVLACVGSWFHNYFPPTRFYTRSLRIQFALEYALFYWNQCRRRKNSEEVVLQWLREACRLARRTPLGERIHRIIIQFAQSAAPDDAVATATVGGELGAVLEYLSVHRPPRFPILRYWVLPANCFESISAVLAMMGVAEMPATPAVRLWTIGGLLEGLVLFAFAYEALRLVRVVTCKIHDVLSNQAFRVIMISSPDEASRASALAASIYVNIGHFVHILVDEGETGAHEETIPSGKSRFITDAESVPDILTAVSQNADLIVLDSSDENLAALVRSSTNLPASRYLALSPTGSVPQGYAWIEPMLLHVRPSATANKPGADPYRLNVLGRRSLWTDWVFQALVLAGLIFFRIEGGAALGLLIGLAAVAGSLPNQIGPLRRASISRATLRVPRAPDVSHKLLPRVLAKRLWIGAVLLFVAALLLIRSPVGITWGRHDPMLALKLYVASMILLLGGHRLVSGWLFARKWSIDWNFRLLVLRRNARRYGYAHKAFLMATCGRYGQVISLRDDTLDQTDEGFGERRESSLGPWFAIFSEIGSTIRPEALLHTWQRQILLELEVTDFAVFDWIDEITDNMRWELRSACERLPAHRIVIVYSPKNYDAVEDVINAWSGVLTGRPQCLVTTRGPDDEYIWSTHQDFDQAFAECLYKALSALVVEPRGRFPRAVSGAWPYPR